nr:DUF5688 family protein [uncultured Butyrivibrio sp.]
MNNEMTREYANEVAKNLEAIAPEMEYKVTQVNKNHAILTGIVAKKAENSVAPTIYVDGYYEDNIPAEDAAKMILEAAQKAYDEMPDFAGSVVNDFADYDKMKTGLSIVLTGDKEYAKQCVSRKVGSTNLYAIPIIRIKMGNESGQIKIKKEHLDKWGIDKTTLFKDAKKALSNEAIAFGGIGDFLGMDIGDAPMCVASNEMKVNGAAVMLSPDFDKMCLEKYPEGYYIIPSSVHEVIVVSKELMPVAALESMVREVNATVVSPEDVLCDNVLAIENGKLVVVEDELKNHEAA